MHIASIDWPTAMVVLVYGVVCWMGGWHASLRASGAMYDEGYRSGHRDGRHCGGIGKKLNSDNGNAEEK